MIDLILAVVILLTLVGLVIYREILPWKPLFAGVILAVGVWLGRRTKPGHEPVPDKPGPKSPDTYNPPRHEDNLDEILGPTTENISADELGAELDKHFRAERERARSRE